MNDIAILFTNKFLSDSKKLSKKYPSFKSDLKLLVEELKLNPNLKVKVLVQELLHIYIIKIQYIWLQFMINLKL